jgi:hypothetical protein
MLLSWYEGEVLVTTGDRGGAKGGDVCRKHVYCRGANRVGSRLLRELVIGGLG